MDKYPEKGDWWKHHSGRVYEVITVANENSTDLHRFPVTVVYFNIHAETVWARPLNEFVEKLKFIPTSER